MDNLIKLIQLCEDLMKHRKNNIAFQILNYVQSLEIENYFLKTQLLYYSGKLFKNEGNISKAIMAFEECLYLGSLNEDNKVRIKAIVSVSSCYLESGDLHKVIYYYHKLIDIEQNLFRMSSQLKEEIDSSDQFSESLINIELRIAIRQNLFTAHHRLGKLRICCYYLNEIIDIIDKKFNLNIENINENIFYKILLESFEFIQIKIDASIELIKLYIIFGEYIKLNNLLNGMLKFVEIINEFNYANEKHIQASLNNSQMNSLRYFKIKCYSYLGICLAGLRDFRYSKLCTKKALCLIDKEIELKSSLSEESAKNDAKLLKLLKIECLLEASDSCLHQIKVFKEMKITNDLITYDNNDSFNCEEKRSLLEMYEKRIDYAKNAYMLSKSFIDPNLRVQTTFQLALALYDNELYQSAAYYFGEVLSISTILMDTQNQSNIYTDATPDYNLESIIYQSKCHLLIDYFELDSDELKVDFEDLFKKLKKCKETLTKRILKWKLHETNRASFLFNVTDIENLKQDKESGRLRNILNLCIECLSYVCYKLEKYDESVLNIEVTNYILNSSSLDITENKLINKNTEEFNSFQNYKDLTDIIQNLNTSCLIYRFIFNNKLLIIFFIDHETGEIVFHNLIKITQLLSQMIDIKYTPNKLNDSIIDYFYKKFELIENEYVKESLNDIESRDIVLDDQEIVKMRLENRSKERKYFNFLYDKYNERESDFRIKFYMDDLDLFHTRISDELNKSLKFINGIVDKNSNSTINMKEIEKEKQLRNELYLNIIQFFSLIVVKPIEKILISQEETVTFVINSNYAKMFLNSLYLFNQTNNKKLSYLITYDSYLLFAINYLNSIEKYAQEDEKLEKIRKENNKAIRFDIDNNEPDTIKISKSLITPRYTSNPKLAVDLINKYPESDHIIINKSHVKRVKNRLNSATGILISETTTGTNAKKSYLEIIDYKQIHNIYKCCVIGCPELPKKLSSKTSCNRFLSNGFEQMKQVAKILNTEPIFSHQATKPELLAQLEISTVVFLSTFSTNESDSILICAETKEYPSSGSYEFDKYCKFTSNDLNSIEMFRCNLLILNCYSLIHNKPRIDLAKKFISRGCKCVLMVMTPLPDKIMNEFYNSFFNNLKKLYCVNTSYLNSIQFLENYLLENSSSKKKTTNLLINKILRSTFCLIGAKKIKIEINEIGKSMLHSKVDLAFENLNTENDKNYLNPNENLSILSSNYVTNLERTLSQLQLLTKFLLNQLIIDVGFNQVKKNFTFKKTFLFLNDLISKSIFYIKTKKYAPEPSNDLVDENLNVINLLKCLGFSVQRRSISKVRDVKDKYVIIFPDQRYLDLNLRLTHVLSSLIELCFDKILYNKNISSNEFDINSELGEDDLFNDNETNQSNEEIDAINAEETDKKIKSVIFNLQSLLPINDKNLLASLIDILAFTKFSPEITLSTTDQSIYFALNFYQSQSKLKNKMYSELLDQNIDKWKNLDECLLEKSSPINPSNFTTRYGINNKVVNFLISIGFEIIGTWLRFNDNDFNRKLIDCMLKFLTSFTSDRDMSLYKELNINVLGQRYSARSLSRTMSNLNKENLNMKKDEMKYDLLVANPWSTLIETPEMMERKIYFIDKYLNLKNKITKEREETLRHHLNYLMKQNEINSRHFGSHLILGSIDANSKTINLDRRKVIETTGSKIKYKTGGGPSKDRIIVNENYDLDLDQINHLRHYSHYFCERNLKKIDIEKKEKVQNLMLPLIKSLNNANNMKN